MIGKKFRVIREAGMLGNPKGSIGYVFNEYQDFEDHSKKGVQIIFKNGDYCGFSHKDLERDFEFVEDCPQYAGYKFRGVMWVSRDFDKGYWNYAS